MMIENKFTTWMKEEYSKEELKNIAEHGCGGGVHGLCYYSETVKIYESYKEEIWEILRNSAEAYEYDNVIDMIAKCASREYDLSESHELENYLVWFAVKEVAYKLIQSEEKTEVIEEEQSSGGGSDTLYRHSIAQGINCGYLVYTAGVLDWAKVNEAHWLIDLIVTLVPVVRKKTKERMYTVKFTVNQPNKGTVIVTDGNSDEPLVQENLSYVSFSRKVNLKLFLVSNNHKNSEYCLMFPDEY